MIGLKFGRWTVIESSEVRTAARGKMWICRCECGSIKLISSLSLKNGMSKSCGCLKSDLAKRQNLIHGHETKKGKSRTYTTWDNMTQRCTNPNRPEYKYYGGRGITICTEWKDFATFYADMGERPNGMSLDRIDTNGNYEPNNCKWSTRAEQMLNRRPYSQRSDKGTKRTKIAIERQEAING